MAIRLVFAFIMLNGSKYITLSFESGIYLDDCHSLGEHFNITWSIFSRATSMNSINIWFLGEIS